MSFIPEQSTDRRTIKGLAFNLMVVGPTGIGKSTLIKSLFGFDFGDSPDYDRKINNVGLYTKEFRPTNKFTDLKFTIIESKGFNNQLDGSKIFKPIVDYIDARYKDHLRGKPKYNDINDNRVHCCIYMIPPTARGLKPLDLVTMKELHQRVCLIPVIARSDQLTRQERQAIKRAIMKEISEHRIQIYSPPGCHDLPFAVAASDDIITENGTRHRVRAFPWGQMFIERDSDFPLLRNLVLNSDMLLLIRTTNKKHYEKFRKEAGKNFKDLYYSRNRFEGDKSRLLRAIDEKHKN